MIALARRLVDTLYADGPDTEWNADMLAAIDALLDRAERTGEINATDANAQAYVLARTLFPTDGEWDTGDLGELERGLRAAGLVS